MRGILKRLFSMVEHYTTQAWKKIDDLALTENDGMVRRPPRGVREHAYTVKHDADRERVVRGAGTRQGAIEMCAHQYGMFFSLGCAVGYAYDDVSEVSVCLVKSFAHHVEPEK